jgi:biopolymer transport protein ExbB/TolQ
MLNFLANHSPLLILLIGAGHAAVFAVLRRMAGLESARLKSFLATLHRHVAGKTDADVTKDDLDLIEDYLGDIEKLFGDPAHEEELAAIRRHLLAKTESLNAKGIARLQSWHAPSRAFIEAYPFLGIIGTLLAMGVALPQASGAGAVEAEAMAGIVQAFSAAIWSTVWGLALAILFLILNSTLEPKLDRLVEDERLTRDFVIRLKTLLPSGRN